MCALQNKRTGSLGETLASSYLQRKGYRILGLNVTSRWGEIDIIAEYKDIICFIEVKTRKSLKQGNPVEAVTKRKVQHLLRTIQYIIQTKGLGDRKFQLDIVGIVLNKDNSVQKIQHYQKIDITGF